MADNLLAPFSYPVSEYTTDPEMRQERVSQALGWDTSRPWRELGMRALTQLPLALGMRSPAPLVPRTQGGLSLQEIQRRHQAIRGDVGRIARDNGLTVAPPVPQSRPGGPTQGQRDLYELNPSRPVEFGPGAYSERRLTATPDPVRAERYWDALGEFRLGPNTPQSVPRSNAPQRGPTQGQRDLYAMERPLPQNEGLIGMRDMNYSASAGTYQAYAALRQTGGNANEALRLLADNPQARNVLNYWINSGRNVRALGDPGRTTRFDAAASEFNHLEPPPLNRLNALLPFAGAAATAPWLVPDEPY